MLIRSQNKEFLINFNYSFELSVMECSRDEFLVTCCGLDETLTVGRYSIKEKALKVLDMIQEAYVENETLRTISTGTLTAMLTKDYTTTDSVDSDGEMLKNHAKIIIKSAVFQMPADSEVVV